MNQNKEIDNLKKELIKKDKIIEKQKYKINELKSENNNNLNKIKSLEDIIKSKDEELNKYKNLIDTLKLKNEELENKFKSLNNNNLNIQSLKDLIIKKDEEINKLKEQLKNNNNNSKKSIIGDKCVTFISTDQKVCFGIPCSGNSIFAEVEELLYQE